MSVIATKTITYLQHKIQQFNSYPSISKNLFEMIFLCGLHNRYLCVGGKKKFVLLYQDVYQAVLSIV